MSRAILAGLCLALVAACGNEGGGQGGKIVGAAIERIRGGGDGAAEGGAPTGPPAVMTREQVAAAGVAMIRARSTEQAGRSTFAAQTVNGGYVSYISRFGQMMTLNGSLITGSRGIGTDLLSLASAAGDPVVTPTPLGDWPNEVRRTYRFPGALGPDGRVVTVTCRYVPGRERDMEIVEVVHQGRQIEEICTDGDAVEFTNTHFADFETGRVWRSVQWLGPEQGFVDLEVIEPFTGG